MAGNDMATNTSHLATLVTAANWSAVDEAARLGPASLPVLANAFQSPNYTVRQISVTCAGQVIDPEADKILARGLYDANVNVRMAAGNELSRMARPGAKIAVLDRLKQSVEEPLLLSLALAAGYMPGEDTRQALRLLLPRGGDLMTYARMALARLGDPLARKGLLTDLHSVDPHARYEATLTLQYVADPKLAVEVIPLLNDRENALLIGPPHAKRVWRRVCDAALETLVLLLRLPVTFTPEREKIYTESEFEEVRRLLAKENQ